MALTLKEFCAVSEAFDAATDVLRARGCEPEVLADFAALVIGAAAAATGEDPSAVLKRVARLLAAMR